MEQNNDHFKGVDQFSSYQNELKQTYCFCIRRRKSYKLQPERKILVGIPNKEIPDNSIETSKYNLITFLPKNLIEQFSKTSNMYFLLVGVLQIIQRVSTTSGQPTVYIPLLIIVLVSMVKDFFEDYKRHKADNEENSKDTLKYIKSQGIFDYDSWQSLRVGDIIKVNNKQVLPCDIALLASSNKKGNCFIQTKNLDGETNLKPKYAPVSLSKIYGRIAEKEIKDSTSVLLEYERQNPLMYKFKGTFSVQDKELLQQKEFFCYENFLERGCSLQNTDFVIGVVVYSGHDTKIMMNSIPGKMKYSRVEKQMRRQIILVFLFLVVQCIFCSAYHSIWYHESKGDISSYLYIKSPDPEANPATNYFLRFAMWFLLLSNCVPISLLVTLEMVKFAQGVIIQLDQNFLYQEKNAQVNSSNLTEQLGVVDFIFSDKTGTLTCNIMKFKKLSVFGIQFGNKIKDQQSQFHGTKSFQNDLDEDQLIIKQSQVQPSASGLENEICDIVNENSLNRNNQNQSSPNVDFLDPNFLFRQDFETKKFGTVQLKTKFKDQPITTILTLLSLCHSVVTETQKDDDKNSEITYNASSPDDLALVCFADEIGGFKFLGKDDDQILSVLIKGTSEIMKYKLLQIIDFTSDRKRMSVIVQEVLNAQDQEKAFGRIFLFIKGADNIIIQMLSKDFVDDIDKRNLLLKSQVQLKEYATTGLRTLLLAGKELEENQWKLWKEQYSLAQAIMNNDEQRSTLMGQLEETIEQELEIIGVTAIEDKLQDKVGEVIHDLKAAGINVWVLTGDKIETAINIGFSCKLLSEEMTQFIIDGENESQVEKQLTKVSAWIEEQDKNRIYLLSIIVGGAALTIITHNQSYKEQFFGISLKSQAVMACRVSPKQKQEIVAMIKKGLPNKNTLSIGDGANDVSMITEAHVGVGIRGLEGQQAARASDYAIGEFQQLRRLLFYCGQESYRKNSFLILFNFYKNQLYIATYFFYGFMTGFSGQYIYDQWLAQVFNLIFTSLPVIFFALFDERHPSNKFLQVVHTKPNYLELRPDLYNYFLKNPLFTMKSFWVWFFWGIFQSVICLIIGIYCFTPTSPIKSGLIPDYLQIGMVIFGGVIIISNLQIIILHYTNYPLFIFINILSSVSYFFCLWFISRYAMFESFNFFFRIVNSPISFLSVVLMVGFTTFIDVGINRNKELIKVKKSLQILVWLGKKVKSKY